MFGERDLNTRAADKEANRISDIKKNIQGREALIKKVYIDLGTARDISNGLKISIPFKSVTVEAASDTTAYLNLSLGDNTLAAMNDAKILKSNDSFEFESMVSASFLWWPAQSGKYLTLVFATTGTFKPGSQISQISGGVTIQEGSSFSEALLSSTGAATSVSVTTTATQLLKLDTDRKVATLYTDAPIFLGGSSVTAGVGVPVGPGQFQIRNTAAIYAITAAGTATVIGVVEK
jgi:hypothetical protein